MRKQAVIARGMKLIIHGVVQGVGFRPFVYRLAKRFQITGSVANNDQGVVVIAFAAEDVLESFVRTLGVEHPPLASILTLDTIPLSLHSNEFSSMQDGDFSIINTDKSASGNQSALIPPDIAVCDDCLADICSKNNRRYQYPFTNCTSCGPRFTIVEKIPYDRSFTSMKEFVQCDACGSEYNNPGDRRFHAQPNGCPVCGPHIFLCDRTGKELQSRNPLRESIRRLAGGEILALRGLGGFHLIVDGTNQQAITRLRQKKKRKQKPLAIMVRDVEQAGKICRISRSAGKLLVSHQRPIVLLPVQGDRDDRDAVALPENLAPGITELGVMLPYTPLHYLLFFTPGCPDVLVMTSGNRSGEPICVTNKDGLDRLASIADLFLLHNREIVTRIDDSVARIMAGKPRLLRRARGYVPAALQLPWQLPSVLACGGGLKSTFCLAADNRAMVSQHIGDLFNVESLDLYQQSIYHLQNISGIKPEIVVCDLHPDYLSSHYARDYAKNSSKECVTEKTLPLYRVQHHHAHAVAVMAEHRLTEEVLAVILDGSGYGTDGTVWGGELLRVTAKEFQRIGHLEPLPLPGGDAAAKSPWRMALAALFHSYDATELTPLMADFLRDIDPARRKIIIRMMSHSFNTPMTSSCGRLFDAVAALLDICYSSDYEGQAAMELESVAAGFNDKSEVDDRKQQTVVLPVLLDFMQEQHEQKCILRVAPMIRTLVAGRQQGIAVPQLALAFHSWLCRGMVQLVMTYLETELHQRNAKTDGIKTVVLAGGCLQNKILFETMTRELETQGLTVVSGEKIPINDGGISLGQAVIGGLRHVSRSANESH